LEEEWIDTQIFAQRRRDPRFFQIKYETQLKFSAPISIANCSHENGNFECKVTMGADTTFVNYKKINLELKWVENLSHRP